mmetsp:Transcript_26154/g.57411  ORF Transcript_26154/g.57411 Transcript_26154/m.57411 type:complete len:460 (+) Transcript_26154:1604-2983(+)
MMAPYPCFIELLERRDPKMGAFSSSSVLLKESRCPKLRSIDDVTVMRLLEESFGSSEPHVKRLDCSLSSAVIDIPLIKSAGRVRRRCTAIVAGRQNATFAVASGAIVPIGESKMVCDVLRRYTIDLRSSCSKNGVTSSLHSISAISLPSLEDSHNTTPQPARTIATPITVRRLGGASPTTFIAMRLALSGSVSMTIDTTNGSKYDRAIIMPKFPPQSGKIERKIAAGLASGFKKPKNPLLVSVEKTLIPFGNVERQSKKETVIIPILMMSVKTIGCRPTGASLRQAVIYIAPPIPPMVAIIAPRLSFSGPLLVDAPPVASSSSPPLAQTIAPTRDSEAPAMVAAPGVSAEQFTIAYKINQMGVVLHRHMTAADDAYSKATTIVSLSKVAPTTATATRTNRAAADEYLEPSSAVDSAMLLAAVSLPVLTLLRSVIGCGLPASASVAFWLSTMLSVSFLPM